MKMAKYRIAGMLGLSVAMGCSTPPKPMTPGQIRAVSQADPDMAEVLDALAGLNGTPIETLDASDARKQPSMADAAMVVMKKRGISVPDVGGIRDKNIPGPNGQDLGLHIYTPVGTGPFPVIVYFHGGGWVLATPETYDSSCRALCNGCHAVVVSVNYRRAPEDKFPAAHDDCFTAMEWVLLHADQVNGIPQKVAVVGESAGGNMAAAACLMAKDKHMPMPIAQVLIYPVAGSDMNTPSYQRFAEAVPLNKAMMVWFFQQYLASPERAGDRYIDLNDVKVSDLSGLPMATVVTDEIDPLMSEGQTYAQHLGDAGVPTKPMNYTGVTHEFFGLGQLVNKAAQAQQFVITQLNSAFAMP
jgi:acetyl esterase